MRTHIDSLTNKDFHKRIRENAFRVQVAVNHSGAKTTVVSSSGACVIPAG